MSRDYQPFASYLRFEEILADPMGHLYRAGEFDAGGVIRVVWLRVLDGASVPKDEVCGAFERARLIADAVQSTSIASGFDAAAVDGVPAIVNDYVPSRPLSLILERAAEERFPVPVDNALLILEKVSLALTSTSTVEIDGERVLHGLLHPGLILVTNDGEGLVTGFGIASQLLQLLDDGEAAGSIAPYLAPEVIASRHPSRQGDVYSLGAILFHLLTGGPLPAEVGDRAGSLEGATLGDDDLPLPDDIRSLLQRSLADQPEDRFNSAADFKKELDRLLYGGAYSPTTFNLALFMDRLFRAEIEAEEREVESELQADVSAYLESAVETQPAMEEFVEPRPSARPRRGFLIALAATVVVAAVVGIVSLLTARRQPTTAIPATPTAAEIEAEREAQDRKMRELAEDLVAEMMAAKEEEIRQELSQRQAKIDELQRRLEASERRAREGELTGEEARRREELQRQIAAEEQAQRQQEADLAAERERAADEARTRLASGEDALAGIGTGDQEAPTSVDTPELGAAPEAQMAVATELPTAVPTTQPTVVPTPLPTATPIAPRVQTNDFVDPTDVDSLPVVLKEEEVVWPRTALMSRRQGVVIIRATVNADGLVEDVEVLRADHDGFGIPQAVSDAAMRYRFKPGTKDGVRIKTFATITKRYHFVVR